MKCNSNLTCRQVVLASRRIVCIPYDCRTIHPTPLILHIIISEYIYVTVVGVIAHLAINAPKQCESYTSLEE